MQEQQEMKIKVKDIWDELGGKQVAIERDGNTMVFAAASVNYFDLISDLDKLENKLMMIGYHIIYRIILCFSPISKSIYFRIEGFVLDESWAYTMLAKDQTLNLHT